ncbi:MAG: Arm DNA-binding domain-containing protein [Methylobacter sp.]|nr:Arm DNA-binding domain-containing protein [Methylobacter sp.]
MLTDAMINDAEPRDKSYKLADSGGMFILVHPNCSKYWRMDYRFNGKRLTKALGIYPAVSIEAARTLRDTFKRQIKDGTLSSLSKEPHVISLAEFTDSQLITELKRRKLINF